MSASGHPNAPYTIFVDKMFKETMQKLENKKKTDAAKGSFVVTPAVWRDAVVAEKPNNIGSTKDRGKQTLDEEYLRYSTRQSLPPRSKYDKPVTASHQYGWDTKPLIPTSSPFAHRPRRGTEVTQIYGPATSVYDPRARLGFGVRAAR
ncbi:hypothetical protein DFJ77DRAFT_508209 [Powellomyces hirtus]|nr:hypothetical protein DFJ77DRAFT_508209 [Powellomyces hirtus]